MNFLEASSSARALLFRIARACATLLPGGRLQAFGTRPDQISSILVINLDRQPGRWQRITRELKRFRTSSGASLLSLVRRLPAIDARDGRAVAATADVDALYRMGDQLFVQPDPQLEDCFGADTPIRMTRQEIAVARSHVEAWKAIASGSDEHVLVLEDDIWFRRGARAAIDRGWRAARQRWRADDAPTMLYLSYKDAGGTAERADRCEAVFRPVRGLWFLSGYVLSRAGAGALLRAMPVTGPVDLWINHQLGALDVLALSSPALLQREDGASDNAYSILPFLARAGIVDAGSAPMRPGGAVAGPVYAWTAGGDEERLAMALSMLGLRVRSYGDGDEPLTAAHLARASERFEAFVDARLGPAALARVLEQPGARFILEPNAAHRAGLDEQLFPPARTIEVDADGARSGNPWQAICALLDLELPVEAFPKGTPRAWGTFRDGRSGDAAEPSGASFEAGPLDDSPWVLPAAADWRPSPPNGEALSPPGLLVEHVDLTAPASSFPALVETFPGNLASFSEQGVTFSGEGARLELDKAGQRSRPYRSGALASTRAFLHGRFQAEIKAAPGPGVVTGFFLHRDLPRQEIDIELAGNDPTRMLTNVYFNPGDDGAALGFGYRGSPCRIDLGFDATEDFHLYAIDWRPGRIAWLVDGRVVHERLSWDPTPIPHLALSLHVNLWAPRSEELAGRLEAAALPRTALIRNVSIIGR